MEFISDELSEYVLKYSDDEPKLLKELNRLTHLKVLKPRMLSGAFQGRLLSLVSKLIQPKSILEIGTYTGYSALCLAEGLQEKGQLITIDVNEELYDFTSSFFDRSPFRNQLNYIIGNAIEEIPKLDLKFDLIFIDADKENYLNYLQLVLPKLNDKAVVLVDNVLWSGKVLGEPKANDTETIKLKEFNAFVKDAKDLEVIILPIRDGISVIRKK